MYKHHSQNCVLFHVILHRYFSTYQVSSAWLECRALKGRKKRFVPRPGIEPGTFHLPGGCSTTKLPRPCTFCAVLSILYYFTIIHGWGGCIVAMRECSTIARSLYFLISTYQVSSAWLEMQSAQRKKEYIFLLGDKVLPGKEYKRGRTFLSAGEVFTFRDRREEGWA